MSGSFLRHLVPASLRKRLRLWVEDAAEARLAGRIRANEQAVRRASSALGIIAGLHAPAPTVDNGILYTEPTTTLAEDGLPLPPPELTVGYLSDPRVYIAHGREEADSLRAIMARHSVTLRAGDAVLDWGSSSGRVLRHFHADAQAGVECWGVDLAAAPIHWARQHLKPIKFVTGTVLPHLPFPEARFSLIYGLSVMTHIDQLDDLWIVELMRILKPGGLAVLTIHDEATIAYLKEHGRPDWIPPQADLDDLLARHDRRIVTRDHSYSTYTFHRRDYIQRVWGSYANVLEFQSPWVSWTKHTAVVLSRPR